VFKGVFKPFDKVELRPTHLVTCVSYLRNIRLFHSNLQIIDEAFEYLITQVSEGEKGQYFTLRFVIDMAVKMLNPKFYKYLIDTAAGSCGFTVYSMFWVWGEQLTGKPPTLENREYAQEKVYATVLSNMLIKL
jgi:type I restriction enzyme M protein